MATQQTAQESAEVIKDWATQAITQGYNILNNTASEIGKKIDDSMFSVFSSIFYNALAYNLIGIIVVLWLFYHMRNGFSKDDIFKATIWLITFLFVYGVLSSYGAYREFLSWFLIPQHLLQAGVSQIMDGKDTATILANTITDPIKFDNAAIKFGIEALVKGNSALGYPGNGGASWTHPLDGISNFIYANVAMIPWTIPIIILIFALVILIFIIQITTMLSLVLFGSFAPIMIICLTTPQTKGYFFSWLKNYISISLYLPLSLLPVLIIQVMTKQFGLSGPNLYMNTGYYVFLYIVGIVLAFYCLIKIPEWINIIMGTQEGHSNMAMAQSVVSGGAAAAMTGLSKGANLAKGAASGAWNTAGAISRFAKDPKGTTSAVGQAIKGKFNDKVNQVKEHFGFKASSHHHE